MRKISPILFLLIYLAAVTELHQILRLPVFFEHYVEHRQDSPTISLLDFIVVHYFSGENKDADYTKDQQLPFKNATCLEVSISLAMPPDDFPETKAQVFSLSRNVVLFKSLNFHYSFHFSIWQPPRA